MSTFTQSRCRPSAFRAKSRSSLEMRRYSSVTAEGSTSVGGSKYLGALNLRFTGGSWLDKLPDEEAVVEGSNTGHPFGPSSLDCAAEGMDVRSVRGGQMSQVLADRPSSGFGSPVELADR